MHTTGLNHDTGYENRSNGQREGGFRRKLRRFDRRLRLIRSPLGNPIREVQFLIGFILATLFFVAPALAQDGEAKVRMVHLSPDAPAVRVTVDGKEIEALSNVSYLDSTPYLTLPAGPHKLAVYATEDSSEPVLEVEISAEAGKCYTVAGVGLLADETFGARLFQDERQAEEDKAKVRVIHAIPDVGPARVSVADGPDLFALPGFANASNYVEVDEGTYTLDVTPAGADAPAFSIPDVSVEAGKTYTAFAIGRASDGSVGTIVTDDSTDRGEIVARTGAAAEDKTEESDESADKPEPAEARVASASKDPEPKPEPEAAPQDESATVTKTAAEDPQPAQEKKSASREVAVTETAAEDPQPAQEKKSASREVAVTETAVTETAVTETAVTETAQPVSQKAVYEEPVYYEPAPQPVYHEEPVYHEGPAYYAGPVYYEPAPQPVYYEEVVHYTDVPQTSIPQTNVPQTAYQGVSASVATGSGSVSTSSQTVESYSSVSSGGSLPGGSSSEIPVAAGTIGSTVGGVVGGAVVNGQNAVLNSGARRKFVLSAGKRRHHGKTEDN